jgi:hypothetical protein
MLTTLGVPWKYEEQGYDLGSAGLYLPDFSFSPPWKDLWLEIKPDTPTLIEFDKARELARQGKAVVIIAAGTPGEEKIWVVNEIDILGPKATDGYCVWCDLFKLCSSICSPFCLKTRAAYNAARAARFEYGEKGNVA